jgi:hypothetical protein
VPADDVTANAVDFDAQAHRVQGPCRVDRHRPVQELLKQREGIVVAGEYVPAAITTIAERPMLWSTVSSAATAW